MSPLFDTQLGQVKEVAQFYQIVELIGVGRFSEVYRAFDTAAQTDVAFKVYLQPDEQSLRLMHAERDVLVSLGELNQECFPKHRKAITTRIRHRNHSVLVMELGQYVAEDSARSIVSLRDVTPDGRGNCQTPLPAAWTATFVISFVKDLLRALRLIHGRGLIHRDLKPANILLKRPPGVGAVIPFLIDFNSSTPSERPLASSGTRKYLPPEVRSDQRTEPSIADDIWAVGVIAWELVHGTDQQVAKGVPPHSLLRSDATLTALQGVLLKALAVDPSGRFSSAEEMLAAVTVLGGEAGITRDGYLAAEEFASARSAVPQLRNDILEMLAGPDEFVVSKEVREQVATLFAWFSEDQTQTLDLSADIAALGPSAIPAALEEGYKLVPGGASWDTLARALARVGRSNERYAERAIVHYSLSSSIGTRALVRSLCAELELFPTLLLDLLVADDGLLLASERVELAGLCIQYCSRPSAVIALVKYMCREYIVDRNRYFELRDKVATRMSRLRFEETALRLVQDAERHIWEEIDEFERVAPGRRPDVQRGLMQLMGDAFASQGDAALALFKRGAVPSFSSGEHSLPIFRTFGKKLDQRWLPAHEWFVAQALTQPNCGDLAFAREDGGRRTNPALIDVRALVERYVDGDEQAFGDIRFSRDPGLFTALDEVLSARPSAALPICRLLRGFQSSSRNQVVRLAMTHWTALAAADYECAADVVSAFAIRESTLRQEVVDTLERDLKGNFAAVALRGIDSLLEHQ